MPQKDSEFNAIDQMNRRTIHHKRRNLINKGETKDFLDSLRNDLPNDDDYIDKLEELEEKNNAEPKLY